MNRTFGDKIKALELNPEKEYILLVSRTVIDPSDFADIPKMKNVKVAFIVNDINNIQLQELDDLQSWIDEQRAIQKHA